MTETGWPFYGQFDQWAVPIGYIWSWIMIISVETLWGAHSAISAPEIYKDIIRFMKRTADDDDDDDDDNEHEAKVHPCHVWQLKWRRASQAVDKQGDIDSAAEYFAD